MRTVLLYGCICLACVSQTRTAGPESPLTNLPAHKIGANDLLSVSVYDAPEISKMVRVSEDGHIRLPMLRTRIDVAGAMPADVETLIVNALETEEILVAPVVTVTVADYSSRPINVAGAVRQPQTFQVIGPMRLLDAISKAGGLSDAAGSEILVSRAAEPIQRISVKGLFESSDASLNIRLYGGEDIRIVEAGKAFVVGNIKRPGAFALRDTEESTVLQLLALAEGLTPFSARQAYIYRRGSDAVRKEIVIELDQILRRKHSDVAVVADDILYIPENKGRKLGMAALEKMLLFGGTAGATALVYSNR
jgi:polysaccharide biosynthesis/export protein